MKKKKANKIMKYFFLVLIGVFLVIGLKKCSEDMEEIKKEKAYEHISNCENPYAFWQGVDGKSCDDARKTYYEYTDEEWEQEKRNLIDFGKITEEDYLYFEIKEEMKKNGGS